MRKTVTIWKKESLGLFTSPRAYVLGALIVALCALWFWLVNLNEARDASMRPLMGLLAFLMLAVTPILTMRLVAEENARGTLELLLTSPVREYEIVLGKFFGAVTLFVALFGVTLVFPAILYRVSEPETGPIVAQYLGMLLLASAFVSVGLFASSITQSQVIAGVVAYALLFGFWVIRFFSEALPSGLGSAVKAVSFLSHLENFARGIVDAVDVFYYLAFTGLFLFLTLRSIEARRWA